VDRVFRNFIVVVALGATACSGATTPPPSDGPKVTASAPQAASGAESKGHPSDRLARARNARKDFDNGCPADMAKVDVSSFERDGRGMRTSDFGFCVDRWEASLVEIAPDGTERVHSPYMPVGDARVRAVSRPGVYPQGYISAVEASRACAAAEKRLCQPMEWRKACVGPDPTVWGYGTKREARRCNDHGKSPVALVFGADAYHGRRAWERLNSPMLNQLDGTLAKTGEHSGCTNGYGVYDMVGNLHEWVADPSGTFYGGFYQDTRTHGEGCTYVTNAHKASYHDYSTGFRCCADAASRP
jgi:Sulfatase-modifying factor enzyme 1